VQEHDQRSAQADDRGQACPARSPSAPAGMPCPDPRTLEGAGDPGLLGDAVFVHRGVCGREGPLEVGVGVRLRGMGDQPVAKQQCGLPACRALLADVHVGDPARVGAAMETLGPR